MLCNSHHLGKRLPPKNCRSNLGDNWRYPSGDRNNCVPEPQGSLIHNWLGETCHLSEDRSSVRENQKIWEKINMEKFKIR